MLTGVGHRDQAVGRVRPRALRLPKLLSATLESIHPETPPPRPVSDPHPLPTPPPPLPLPPASTARHTHPPDVRKLQLHFDSRIIFFFFFFKSFSFISLISAHLVPAPLLFSSPLSSILLSSLLSSSFPAVMEIRLEKSLILWASHRLRVRPSYLGEKREENRQKRERGDKRERGGKGVDRWGKKSSRGFADVLQVDKNGEGKGQVTGKWGKANRSTACDKAILKEQCTPKIRNTFHLICSRRLLEIIVQKYIHLLTHEAPTNYAKHEPRCTLPSVWRYGWLRSAQ